MNSSKSYHEDGLVLLRGFLPGETSRRIASIAERVHAEWLEEQGEEAKRQDLVNSSKLTASRYFPPELRAERVDFFDALANSVLFDLVTQLFGKQLYFHGTQMFFNPLGGRRRPYWHRDIQYMGYDESRQKALLGELRNLHIRIPLRPERNFMLVPGSHARWDTDLERDVRLEQSGHASWEDLPSARSIDLQPTDVLIFSAHMLHRGTFEGNADRLSLDLMLGELHAQVPIDLDPDELPNPDELAKVLRPHWYERSFDVLRGT